jgi:hypothetical protein
VRLPTPSNWQRGVAQSKATVSNGVLCLVGPELTAEEWAARYVTEYRSTSGAQPVRRSAARGPVRLTLRLPPAEGVASDQAAGFCRERS